MSGYIFFLSLAVSSKVKASLTYKLAMQASRSRRMSLISEYLTWTVKALNF